MKPLKPYWQMTRKELMSLDHIPLGEALDTEEKMIQAAWDFDEYWRNLPHPVDFESAYNDWLPTQPWYKLDTQADAGVLRQVYFLWKFSEGKINKRIRKVLTRIAQTRKVER